MSGTVLIAYHGSDDAGAAVRHASELLAGRDAVVLCVWESSAGLAGGARVPLPSAVVAEAMRALDAAAREQAEKIAGEGAAAAREAGLEANAVTVKAQANVSSTILAEAERHAAAVVVVGSRGRSGLKPAILGSVSSALASRAPRPVLVARAGDASG